MSNRRKLILALGVNALLVPFGSFAQQQGRVWRVGFIGHRSRPDSLDSDIYGALPRGMRELGYVEGKNLEILWRYSEGKAERLPGLAAELVRLNVDVIVAGETLPVAAAKKATTSIPIVMGGAGDPIGSGFIKSLARPEGNITGLSNFTGDISPKLLDILRSMVPKLFRVAVLVNPTNPAHTATVKGVQEAARGIGLQTLLVEARNAQEIENAFVQMVRGNVGAVIVQPDPTFFSQERALIINLAMKDRMPSIMTFRGYADAGGLMTYGHDWAENYRRAATYVDKILKGAKPADLPVEQPTRFELHINAKTAKALGLTIPQSLRISADKVIE
jgi:putative ABC transport system substrate-binding protein